MQRLVSFALTAALAGCLPDQGRVAEGRMDAFGSDASRADVAESDIFAGACALSVAPNPVSFGSVPLGTTGSRAVTLHNAGAGDCLVDAFELSGHAGFTLSDVDVPLRIAPQAVHTLGVFFASSAPEAAEGLMVVHPRAGQPLTLILQANLGGPCIAVSPPIVEFGAQELGTVSSITVEITSCSDTPLVISRVDVDSAVFSVNVASLPRALAPGHGLPIGVSFVAQAPGDFAGEMRITTNSAVATKRIPLRGAVTESCCNARFTCFEGEDVVSGTTLSCTALEPQCASRFQWELLDWPADTSEPVFIPSPTNYATRLELAHLGSYEIALTTWDATGRECAVDIQTYQVHADTGLMVELVYEIVGDPDESGPVDFPIVDLHLRNSQATWWFDGIYDANTYENPAPVWSTNAAANPTVTGNFVRLPEPEHGKRYTLGVHYRSKGSYGPILAELRVYKYGGLIFGTTRVGLTEGDLWEVATIDWPIGASAVAEPPRIIPNVIAGGH